MRYLAAFLLLIITVSCEKENQPSPAIPQTGPKELLGNYSGSSIMVKKYRPTNYPLLAIKYDTTTGTESLNIYEVFSDKVVLWYSPMEHDSLVTINLKDNKFLKSTIGIKHLSGQTGVTYYAFNLIYTNDSLKGTIVIQPSPPIFTSTHSIALSKLH